MRRFRTVIAFVAAALGAITPALAGELNGTVDNLVDAITRSTNAQPNLAYFSVKLENTKPSAMTGVRFIAKSLVFDATGTNLQSYAATYESVLSIVPDGAVNCGLAPGDTDSTRISCALTTPLLPGSSNSITFTVAFKAPIIDGPATNYLLRLGWSAVFDESGSGASDGGAGGAGTDITLTPASNDKLEVFVPTAGTEIQTVSTDNWTTAVKVPQAGKKLTITESVGNVENTNICVNIQSGLRDCRVSNVVLDGVILDSCTGDVGSPCIVITLRRDASTIKGGRIENLRVYYESDTYEIPLCSNIGGFPTSSNKRCIKNFYEITKKTQGATHDDWGDYIWVIWALENGRAFN